MPWIKLWTEILDDPKLGRLDAATKWHFVSLCLLAGECDLEGYIANSKEPLSMDDISWRLRENPAHLEASMQILQDHGLIALDDGCWLVVNFSKRQGRSQSEKRAAWRERKQRQRDRERDTEEEEEECPEDVTRDSDVTPASVPALEKRREEGDEERREEGDNNNAAAAAPTSSRDPPLQEFLAIFQKHRFDNDVQEYAIAALGLDYDPETILNVAHWARKKGMNLGQAVVAMPQALAKWENYRKQPDADDGDRRRYIEGQFAEYIQH